MTLSPQRERRRRRILGPSCGGVASASRRRTMEYIAPGGRQGWDTVTRVDTRTAVVLVLLVLVAGLTQGCASGPTSGVIATGTIRCNRVVGSVDFSPPLTASGHSAETIAVRANLSHCSELGSNVSSVSGGVTTLTVTVPTNSCSGLLQFPALLGNVSTPSSSRPITADTTWAPKSIRPSVMTFSGFVLTSDDNGDPGFAFPGSGHRAKIVGSFAGSDKGALSVASVFTHEKANAILSRCSSSGLTSIEIFSGQVTLA
jgi:hypothetical protein